MKLFNFFVSLLAAAAATAEQTINIQRPKSGANLTAGQNATIAIGRVQLAQPVTEIGIGVTLFHCNTTATSPCGVEGMADIILYAGRFGPRIRQPNQTTPNHVLHVLIPSNFTKGAALLRVDRAFYQGLQPLFLIDQLNETVNIT